MTHNSDQRAHVRAPLELEIDLESDHNFYSGLTSDISEGGIFVGTHMLPAIGEELEMSLKLPGHAEAFTIRGTVRWLRELRVSSDDAPQGFGMQWKELSSEAAAAIRTFVSMRDTIYYEAA